MHGECSVTFRARDIHEIDWEIGIANTNQNHSKRGDSMRGAKCWNKRRWDLEEGRGVGKAEPKGFGEAEATAATTELFQR